jgi:acetolactate synthase I/II/III large subunit
VKLADALAVTLRDWGVQHVFGVSGANIEHFHDAVYRLGSGRLTAVMAKTEAGAAFMADCTARLNGTLGVCCATSGGGMMNLAVGVAEAHASSVPLLAIVGQPPRSLEGRGAFQDSSGIGRSVDARALFGAISKYVGKIDSARSFWPTLARAVAAALSGRPGPAVLLLPRDVYELDVPPRPRGFPTRLSALYRPRLPTKKAVRALFDLLREARRPVLLLGEGVARSARGEQVRAFALKTGTPVVTSMEGLAAFPHDHPLFLGAVGATGHPSAHAYLNEQADLIVAVGTDMGVLTHAPIASGLARCKVALVSSDPSEALRSTRASLVVAGDVGATFEQLSALAAQRPFRREPPAGYVLTRYRPVVVKEREAAPAPRADALLQSEAISMLEQQLPTEGRVLFDAGNCAAAALHGMSVPRGVQTTVALGMGGMGYAVAGAIGAQLGASRGRTVVLCGDGAFLMHGLEIHTAVELRLPILFVVFNNSRHGMCVTRQQLMFGGRLACSEYADVDVSTVARGLGPRERLWCGSAATRAELAKCLADFALHTQGPGVLELILKREEVPPFAPFLDEDAPTVEVRKGRRTAA